MASHQGAGGSKAGASGSAGTSGASGNAGAAGGGCVPKTCVELKADCGPLPDGCGNVVQCGSTCPMGETCVDLSFTVKKDVI